MRDESHNDTTGSSIDPVLATTTTPPTQEATAGTRSTTRNGICSRAAWPEGRRIQRKPAAATAARPATARNGRRMPPVSYSQPPSEGPNTNPKLVPDMTMPITRPRSEGP